MTYSVMDDLEIMALTVMGEARGETSKGQQAVASVIFNRYQNPRWWCRNRNDGIVDDTIAAVCLDPYQFSCWNPNDPNCAKLKNPSTKQLPLFLHLKEICRQVLSYELPDPTNTSDHYCVTKIAKYTKWAKGRKPEVVIGAHSFYRIEL